MARGDDSAVAGLYDATSRVVFGLAARILGDAQAAEEVVLDVYLQAWRQASSYAAGRGSPLAWLLTIARSRAIDRRRSGALRRRRERPLSRGFEVAWAGGGPEAAGLEAEERRRVMAALARLPAEQQRAIELAFFQGLTHAEIARKLGEPVGTVKTRIRLGMMKLRSLLEPLEGNQ
jgi:RNA polymerase sigma-70 factor (ECF subfamily)